MIHKLSLIPFVAIYALLGGTSLDLKFLVGGPKSIYRAGDPCTIIFDCLNQDLILNW